MKTMLWSGPQVLQGGPLGGHAGSPHPGPWQRVDGEEAPEEDHPPPELRPQDLRQRPRPDGAAEARRPQPEHLAHLPAQPRPPVPPRGVSLDNRLGGHQGGR